MRGVPCARFILRQMRFAWAEGGPDGNLSESGGSVHFKGEGNRMMADWELLDRFAAERDQEAFGELVRRHAPMVHRAAKRMLQRSAQDAEDVTQAVFLLLAQKATQVP